MATSLNTNPAAMPSTTGANHPACHHIILWTATACKPGIMHLCIREKYASAEMVLLLRCPRNMPFGPAASSTSSNVLQLLPLRLAPQGPWSNRALLHCADIYRMPSAACTQHTGHQRMMTHLSPFCHQCSAMRLPTPGSFLNMARVRAPCVPARTSPLACVTGWSCLRKECSATGGQLSCRRPSALLCGKSIA